MVRVTVPGGKVVIAALGPPQKAEFLGLFLAALEATVPGVSGFPDDPPPVQFQLADPARLCERLTEAGLAEITLETLTFGLNFRSAEHFWGFLMSSNPMGRILVSGLTEKQRSDLREVVAGMLRERSAGKSEAVLNIDLNIGIGTR